jgi:uncharacterized protein (DUF1499 family)
MSGRRLAPCPDKPNCVSTQSADPVKRMPPLGFDGEAEPVRAAILDLLARARGVRVVTAEPDYIHAEFTTLLFRFVDDVEFAIDASARRVDFRSASRVGYSDLGTNRRRMEALSRRLVGRAGIALLPGVS